VQNDYRRNGSDACADHGNERNGNRNPPLGANDFAQIADLVFDLQHILMNSENHFAQLSSAHQQGSVL